MLRRKNEACVFFNRKMIRNQTVVSIKADAVHRQLGN
jgi:hypothetical protein